MIITRATVGNQLVRYLNGKITLAMLVDWAESSFIDAVLAPDVDVPMLNDILGYLAAADTAQFPLTWDVCADFLSQLGVEIEVVVTDSGDA